MPPVTLTIGLSDEARALSEKLAQWPEAAVLAIARGMDRGAELALGKITEERFTGEGPFPPIEGRLGVRTNRLRSSLRWSKAQIAGQSVTGGMGSNVEYLRIHELGGVIKRKVKPGKVRLREDRSGNLLRQESDARLAVFAKQKGKGAHKLYREVPYEGGGEYEIRMPARAPLGHGIADHLTDFTGAMLDELRKTWEGRKS